MTYVITHGCCNDATCILECPVDCIRPTPGDPDFATAEMLYIDPGTCIDCGACQDACPVDAIYPDWDLPPHLGAFVDFNAEYFATHPLAPADHGAAKPLKPEGRSGPLRVAIVGSGPAAAYLVEDLAERGNVQIDLLDRLPTPWGLLRSGVAPDHLRTKRLASVFERTAGSGAVDLRLNVEVGLDVTIDQLESTHHAVVLATGASDPVPWTVPGSELTGVHPATDFVAWYNGHPDYAGLTFDLSGERAVVVGNGNVALDVARILLLNKDELARSDVAEHARAALADSRVREVVILGRRGPLQAAYTSTEFHALVVMDDLDVVIDPSEVVLDSPAEEYADELKVRLAQERAAAPPTSATRRVVFRYLVEPVAVLGAGQVESVQIERNELIDVGGRTTARTTGAELESIVAGLVITATGYRSRPIPGVPFDSDRGVISTSGARVVDGDLVRNGLYAVGWAKRGATGGIGAARPDALETAAAIVDDFNAGQLHCSDVTLSDVLRSLPIEVLSLADWKSIDEHETQAGINEGRPRVKLVERDRMLEVARRP